MQDAAHLSVVDVAREAHTLAQSLKESVKRKEALDKDVEFRRKSLRKQHLKLLLLYPTSKEAKDVETHLWMQTSYQFISFYKQRLAVLDKKLFSPAAQANKPSRQDMSGGGPVEYRKILARFRQFLAEEERFYLQLLIRFQSQFGLTEACPALVRAEILGSDQEESVEADPGRNLFPEQADTTPKSIDERETRLASFTKLLVCLGDIARYREQYNDGGGRPRAGHEEGPPRKVGRGGRRGGAPDTVARPRNYSRARVIYEQARLLLPDDGNASHQLAILASYQKDSFSSLLHYYRALCVLQPYDTASDNLNTVLKKALDQYRASKGTQAPGDDPQAIPKVRVDRFMELVVVLHGLWYLDSDEYAARATKHSRLIVAKFKSLISEPALPPNTVSEVVTLAFSALWKTRMIREQHIRANRKVAEPLIAVHILFLLRALFDTAKLQLAVKIDDMQDRGDLAQQITAILRRILPAIRITSKWLRTNVNYLAASETSASAPDSYRNAIKSFWKSYAGFLTSLSDTFPLSKLPVLKNPLEEDVELTGFTPIKRAMFMRPAATDSGLAPGQAEVHPNEEYLMRISDLFKDAEEISGMDRSPVSFSNGKYSIFEHQVVTPAPEPVHIATHTKIESSPAVQSIRATAQESDDDDARTTQTERTDDDVVRDAFNEALGGGVEANPDFDDEDDKIVWSPPKMYLSPLQKIIQPPHTSPPVPSSAQSPVTATASPTRLQLPTMPTSGTTALDLLNNVLGFSRGKGEHTSFAHQQAVSSTPQASLLFGSGSFNAHTKSIWSSTNEQVAGPGHLPESISPFRSASLAPGHERMRSQSFSFSQPAVPQPLMSTQDSVLQSQGNMTSALPVGATYGRSVGHHHQSTSFSGFQDAFRATPAGTTQVFYDSHVPQACAPPIQGLRGHGYSGPSVDSDPFLFYDSGRTNTFAGVGSSAPSVNQSIWGT